MRDYKQRDTLFYFCEYTMANNYRFIHFFFYYFCFFSKFRHLCLGFIRRTLTSGLVHCGKSNQIN